MDILEDDYNIEEDYNSEVEYIINNRILEFFERKL